MINMDMLIRPARPIAIDTSMRLKRSSVRRSSSLRASLRPWVSAECR
jgi:hypothetical protein